MTEHTFIAVLADSQRVEQHLQRLRSDGLRVTVGELITFEFAQVIGDFPELCQKRDANGRCIPSAVDLSLAMNIARKGVMHPVIRQADALSLEEMAVTFKELSLRYFRGELTSEECQDGAITISDMSSFNVAHMIPPIRAQESASLGICAPMPGSGAFYIVYHCDASIADCATVAAMLGSLTARLEAQ